MFKVCLPLFEATDDAISTAAVADYRPRYPSDTKIKKSEQVSTLEFGKNKNVKQISFGFALETNKVFQNAERKLGAKNFDFFVKPCQVSCFYRLVQKIQTPLNETNMKPIVRISGLMILITFNCLKYAYAQEPESDNRKPLFIIERSRDADFLVYDVVEKGEDHSPGPVSIDAYWIKTGKNNRREPLTWIQNQYGYGIEVLELPSAASEELHFRIVAFPWYTFILKKDQGKAYQVYIRLAEGEIEVEKLFVNFTNNSFWHPEVSHVILYGIDPHTGARFTETITPKEMNQNAG